MPARPRTAVFVVGALTSLLTACGGEDSAGGSSGTTVAVAAGDDSCEVERTDLTAGPITFAVTNDGSSTTEVYVYGEDDGEYTRVVSEVENIGPGTSRDLQVDLPKGTYEVACKPGQTGDGIRTGITVTGDGGRSAGASEDDESGYDREIELSTDGATITGLDGGAEAGERIEFKLTNEAAGPRTLEIKDPDGGVAGEVDVDAGATGELVVELGDPGTWQVVVEGDGLEDVVAELPVS
jgi:iron uptake system component EfeO